MAAARRGSRQAGKSDPIDAHAVAHAALREPDLPVAQMDDPARQVKLLSDHRRDLVAERTKLVNQRRWHLHELDPGLHIPSPGRCRYCVIDDLADQLAEAEGTVTRIARNPLVRFRELTVQIKSLERELRDLIRVLAPQPARRSRLRCPRRGDDPGRDCRPGPIPLQARLRPVQRHRPKPGLVKQHDARAAQPRRQPGRQHRPEVPRILRRDPKKNCPVWKEDCCHARRRIFSPEFRRKR